jgi:hypothetical protein
MPRAERSVFRVDSRLHPRTFLKIDRPACCPRIDFDPLRDLAKRRQSMRDARIRTTVRDLRRRSPGLGTEES